MARLEASHPFAAGKGWLAGMIGRSPWIHWEKETNQQAPLRDAKSNHGSLPCTRCRPGLAIGVSPYKLLCFLGARNCGGVSDERKMRTQTVCSLITHDYYCQVARFSSTICCCCWWKQSLSAGRVGHRQESLGISCLSCTTATGGWWCRFGVLTRCRICVKK